MTESIHTEWNFLTVQGTGLHEKNYNRLKRIVQGWCNLLMNRPILFTCACYLQSCSDCSLNGLGCDYAPEGQLLKAAREHYAEMKRGDNFDKYDAYMAKRFGADYAKEFIAAKAKVV